MSQPAATPSPARFRLRLERCGPGLWWDQKRFLAALRIMLKDAGFERRADGAYITAAPVSPPGCASAHEYAELALFTPATCASLMNRLRAALDAGLRLLSVVRLPAWALDIRKALTARCHEVVCPALDASRAAAFLAAAQWPWTRWKKGQARVLDLRPAVPEMVCLSRRVRFAVECSDIAPKPAEIMASVFGMPLAEALLLPTACTGIRMARQPAHRGPLSL